MPVNRFCLMSSVVSWRREREAVYGDLEYVSAPGHKKSYPKMEVGEVQGRRVSIWVDAAASDLLFVRKELYERFGRFNVALKSAADYELMLRFIHKHRIRVGYLPNLLVKMRVGGVSNANIGSRLRANREDRLAWKLNDIRPYFFTAWLKPFRKIMPNMYHGSAPERCKIANTPRIINWPESQQLVQVLAWSM